MGHLALDDESVGMFFDLRSQVRTVPLLPWVYVTINSILVVLFFFGGGGGHNRSLTPTWLLECCATGTKATVAVLASLPRVFHPRDWKCLSFRDRGDTCLPKGGIMAEGPRCRLS